MNRIFRAFCLIILIVFSANVAVAGTIDSISDIKHQSFNELDGKTASLDQYKGKVVLLNFWASWCMPCMMEVIQFNNLHRSYEAKGLKIIGLSVDMESGLTKIKDVTQRWRVRYKVGKADKEMVNQLKVYAIPTSYLFGRDGKLIQKYMGPPREAQIKKDIESALAK